MTPTQAAIHERHKMFRARIAANAVPDTPVSCQSASGRRGSPPPVAEPALEVAEKPIDTWVARQKALQVIEVWPYIPIEDLPPTRFSKIQDIKRAVIRLFPTVTIRDIDSRRRTADVIMPRQIGMFLAKTRTGASLPEIGKRFGGRDHTTALHAVNKIGALIKTDKELAQIIHAIEGYLELHP